MPEHRPLQPAAPWVQVVATDADWDAADVGLLRTMYAQLVWIRAFEEYVLDLAGAGLIHGPAHSSIGQEGGAVGSVLALTSDDSVNGSHRGHHQFLAKALHHVEPKGLDPLAAPSDDVREVLLRTLAEIAGLDRGWSHGRGGSMHLQWKEAGAMGTNAIVGGGVPQAAGFAWAHHHAETDAVSVTYFGDGATNIGSTLETMNLASAWHLPVCFFIENNRYAVSTSVEEATGEPRLSSRGPGFGIASWKVDGMDPLAVHLAMTEAVDRMRHGHGPTVIEADTYRFFHQNGGFAGSAFGYRTKEEEQEWRARDPLTTAASQLVRLDRLRDEPVGCRAEERRRHAEQRLAHDEQRERHVVREEHGGDERLHRRPHEVAAQHDRAPREPVCDHAARECEDDARDRERGEHAAERGGRAVDRQHGEREGDRDDCVA